MASHPYLCFGDGSSEVKYFPEASSQFIMFTGSNNCGIFALEQNDPGCIQCKSILRAEKQTQR